VTPEETAATEPLVRRRILPFERAGALLEVIMCSGLPTQILLIAVLSVFGMSPQSEGGGYNPRFVFTVSLLDAVLVVALVVFFLRSHGESARDVLIGRVRVLKEALLGLALTPVVFLIVVIVLALVLTYAPGLHNVPNNPLENLLTTRTDAAIFALVVMVAGGVREEVQRGFIVHRFAGYLGGGGVGVVFFSVLFGLGHYEQGYDATIATGLLGAFWGAVYLWRRSIVAPVVSHGAFNLAQIVKYLALGGSGPV
jgi:membrane protease YdiL (CAAX protease family)